MAPRILIVDDEPNIVLSLEYLMKREGFEVAVAVDGDAALQALAGEPADVVILDLMLPKVNGFDVCQRIRADPRWGRARIVMLTAKGRETDVARGMRLGADAYVTKPFSTRDLMAQVKRLVGAA